MTAVRKLYKSDLDDETYASMLPYLLLRPKDAPQRIYPLRDVLNALFYMARTGVQRLGQSGTLPEQNGTFRACSRLEHNGTFRACSRLEHNGTVLG